MTDVLTTQTPSATPEPERPAPAPRVPADVPQRSRDRAQRVAERRTRQQQQWFRLAEWPLIRKMAVILALPVLLASLFGGVRVGDQLRDASRFTTLSSQVRVLQPALAYLAAAGDVAAAPTGSRSAETALDRADRDLRRAMASADLFDGQRTELENAVATGAALRTDRASLTTQQRQERVYAIGRNLASTVNRLDSRDLPSGPMRMVTGVISAQQALAGQRIALGTNPAPSAETVRNIADEVGREGAGLESVPGPAGQRLRALNQQRRDLPMSSPASDWQGSINASRRAYDALVVGLAASITATTSQRAIDAKVDALQYSSVILGALLVSLVLTLAVARRVILPIRQVRASVLRISRRGLPDAVTSIRAGQPVPEPEKVPVHTGEETGQLARAVDDMHERALALAAEQARLRTQVGDMFQTLSRRSTSLVNQQLALIQSLERDEQDPRRLESLFRLDHLATRMRRNGDSLLVLAGATTRRPGSRNMPLSDAVRAAQSGVRDYSRVQVGEVPDRAVPAAAVPDLVHLLGELIDNALAYSPPTRPVTVAGMHAVDGGILIEIVDAGLGMRDADLATTNHSLNAGGEVSPETAKQMGLFVVGRLAQRHDIVVRLHPNVDGQGMTASVYLPSAGLIAPERRTTAEDSTTSSSTERPELLAAIGPDADRTESTTAGAAPRQLSSAGLPKRRPGASTIEPAGVQERSDGPILRVLRVADNDDEDAEAPAEETDRAVDRGDGTAVADRTADADSAPADRAEADPASAAPAQPGTPGPAVRRRPTNTKAFFGVARQRPDQEQGESTSEPGEAPDRPTQRPTEQATERPNVRPMVRSAERPAERNGQRPDERNVQRPNQKSAGRPGERAVERRPAQKAAERPRARGVERRPEPAAGRAAERPSAPPSAPPTERSTERRAERPGERPASGPADRPKEQGTAMPDDTPIFGSIQSQWLSNESTGARWSNASAEAGWQAAERVTETPTARPRTASGLPVRTPGAMLVPGSSPSSPNRGGPRRRPSDPAALRDRLNRYQDGVDKGRAMPRPQAGGDPRRATPRPQGEDTTTDSRDD
ncbi:HAMP domain-containing protein [Luteipulveratus sp. YIM 133132]|uniref:ATP-binding protein n=1 Tax=Luteipulveratus flavus TaxID=3031728 RepID=UPI0023AFF729|nr:ATP-binding protein [Luteipulveratus sp. YIM 133132]MDE9366372.1 HAMP domain-containing protein [Luteipulveratus sp. YIM 133132]